jgi:hypothetical protein
MSLIPRLQNFDHGGFWHPATDHLSFYCMIPKNASSWTSSVLQYNGWTQGVLEHCPNQHINELIVVLRDPVDRWVAGIAQYFSSYVLHSHWFDREQWNQGYHGNYILGKENFEGPFITGEEFIKNYNELFERLLFEQIAFDDHTQEQSWFVNHFQSNTRTYFYINESFERTFLYNFREMNLVLPPEPDYNRGKDNKHVELIYNFLHERIKQSPYLRNAIERYYRNDYKMIEQADFKYFSAEELTSETR